MARYNEKSERWIPEHTKHNLGSPSRQLSQKYDLKQIRAEKGVGRPVKKDKGNEQNSL